MSDTTQAPQIPVKQADQRKVMTPEKLERLRLAREVRAKNRLTREEKRMEVAKQFLLASAGHPESKAKSNPEEKKLKWETRKNAMIEELMQKIGEANVRWKELTMKPEPETESESELSGMEEPPAKRPKKSKNSVAKPKPPKTRKSSSYTDTSDRAPKKRRLVKPAVSSTDESESDAEHENVLQLW